MKYGKYNYEIGDKVRILDKTTGLELEEAIAQHGEGFDIETDFAVIVDIYHDRVDCTFGDDDSDEYNFNFSDIEPFNKRPSNIFETEE